MFPFPLLSFQKGNRKGKKTEKREKREKKKETKKGLVIPQLISGITSHHKKIGVNCTCQRNYAALLGAILSQKIEPWTVQHMAKLISVLKFIYIKKKGNFYMYFDVFNSIVFDNENDLNSCLEDDYVRAAMTLDEIAKIVPQVKKIMEAKNFDEILVESEYLIDDLPLPVGDLERWEKHGLTDFEKYCVAFLYAAMQMEYDRYRICRKCGRAYFSTDEFSEFCDDCKDRYSHI